MNAWSIVRQSGAILLRGSVGTLARLDPTPRRAGPIPRKIFMIPSCFGGTLRCAMACLRRGLQWGVLMVATAASGLVAGVLSLILFGGHVALTPVTTDVLFLGLAVSSLHVVMGLIAAKE
ncbi:hypothetical protein [Phreatobacter stygius]|uniref:Uncharacterized protein n=1 Tax=Phreatobacter stygius TaxID=1940610 RepID=A0A4D7B3H1_9HYPH|nr:hypothetical protein [Phreatobacter stygius]QCI64590.1 hypothetical protein E8M01_10325 [Phreatobacter stygius]